MATGTYSGDISTYITLTVSPATITSDGQANFTYGVAVYGGSAGTYDLLNLGTVTDTLGLGVELAGGGSVTNGSAADATAVIAGYYGVILSSSGDVLNYATIGGTQAAVVLSDGGSVTNTAGGTIVSDGFSSKAVNLVLGGTVQNDGSISVQMLTSANNGGSGVGVFLQNGGTLDNSGEISLTVGAGVTAAQTGVYFGGGGMLLNSGTIIAASTYRGYGVDASASSAVAITNEAGGLISGETGIAFYGANGDTVVNAGTIDGTGGTAVSFGTGDDLMQIDAGGVFVGIVNGGDGTDTLELSAGDSATGTLSGLGSEYLNFENVAVDAAANWLLSGSNTLAAGMTLSALGTLTVEGDLTSNGLIDVNGGVLIETGALSGAGTIGITNSGSVELLAGASGTTVDFNDGSTLELSDPTGVTIQDFAGGDTIALTGVTYSASNTVTYNSSLHEIIVYDAGHTTLATLDVGGVALGAGQTLTLAADGTITSIEVVCFLEGTRIRTERGEVPVEALAEGDRVVTASGGLEPVRWIGQRRMKAQRHASPEKVYPIRIKRGAFADNVPMRDLLVSPGHAIFAGGVLIPAHRLVNGVTIYQDCAIAEPNYFHVELDRHDVLLAEGLGAESYLDSGNRGFFERGSRPIALFARPDGMQGARDRCAPLKNGGTDATAVKQALLRRVQAMGYAAGRRPELRLEIDGRVVLPVSVRRWTYTFELPLEYATVRLVSQTATGGATRAGNFDGRRLGVAVRDVTLGSKTVDLRDLTRGWHQLERDGGRRFRWTDGDALLPVAGPGTLEIALLRAAERWIRQVDLVKLRRA